MTFASLKLAGSQSGYRDCEISISSQERGSLYRATCKDTATGIVIGCSSIPSTTSHGVPTISAAEVVRMIGGAYRLASIALEIEADELARRNRRIRSKFGRADAPGESAAKKRVA